MKRIVLEWTGPSVKGLAVTVLHFDDSNTDVVGDVASFLSHVRQVIPNNVTVTYPGSGDVINDATGELESVWSEGAGGSVTGAGADDTAAAGVGACITWLTDGIVSGHRVRGRTFIVPLATGFYQSDGTLLPAAISELNDAGAALVNSLRVWHRPTEGGPGNDGGQFLVNAYRVRDRVAFLSSRRD